MGFIIDFILERRSPPYFDNSTLLANHSCKEGWDVRFFLPVPVPEESRGGIWNGR